MKDKTRLVITISPLVLIGMMGIDLLNKVAGSNSPKWIILFPLVIYWIIYWGIKDE